MISIQGRGWLLHLGGWTDLILSKEIKNFPTPIEEWVSDRPDLKEAAMVGIDDEEHGE